MLMEIEQLFRKPAQEQLMNQKSFIGNKTTAIGKISTQLKLKDTF